MNPKVHPLCKESSAKVRDGIKPPPPTREQYEKMGIVRSYFSLRRALKDSRPGDRIYIQNGNHNFCHGEFKQSQEIVAYPGHSPFLGLTGGCLKFRGCHSWTISSGRLRVKGLTFDHPFDHPYGEGDRNTSLIEFSSQEGAVWIQDCVFDLGTNAAAARPSRVSGVLLKQAEFACIERNKFIGGGGSAVAVLNDPSVCVSHVVIRFNNFVNTGQPSFSEQKTRKISDTEETSLKEDEIAPGPAAVEMWRLNRRLYVSQATQQRETYRTTTCVLTGNHFHQCMRAALAYRYISGVKVVYSDVYSDRVPRPKPSVQLCIEPSMLSTITKGYDIALADNAFVGNGLEYKRAKVASWLPIDTDDDSSLPRRKRSRMDDGGKSDEALATDNGESHATCQLRWVLLMGLVCLR